MINLIESQNNHKDICVN
ncbi:hypothetical protein [Borreliella garinii]